MTVIDWLYVADLGLFPALHGMTDEELAAVAERVRQARAGLAAWRLPLPDAAAAEDLYFDWRQGLVLSRQGTEAPADAGLRPDDFEPRRKGAPWRRRAPSRLRGYLARGLLKRHLVEAGERFEGAWRRAGYDPRLVADYGDSAGGGFDPFDISDSRAEARLELRAVETAVGTGLMRVLIRVCVFDEAAGAMAEGELERGGRTAQVAGMTALELALKRLFEHYAGIERGRP